MTLLIVYITLALAVSFLCSILVVESLMGLEIVDELNSVEDMRAMAKKMWRKRAKKLGLIDPNADVARPGNRGSR